MGDLGLVGLSPSGLSFAYVLGEINKRTAVDPELFERFIEALLLHAAAGLEILFRLGFVVEGGVDFVENLDIRVVAFVEPIVCVAVGVGVHQDRSGGGTVAAGAADFLVVTF